MQLAGDDAALLVQGEPAVLPGPVVTVYGGADVTRHGLQHLALPGLQGLPLGEVDDQDAEMALPFPDREAHHAQAFAVRAAVVQDLKAFRVHRVLIMDHRVLKVRLELELKVYKVNLDHKEHKVFKVKLDHKVFKEFRVIKAHKAKLVFRERKVHLDCKDLKVLKEHLARRVYLAYKDLKAIKVCKVD